MKEGYLSDRQVQKAKAEAEKHITDLAREDLHALERDARFRRWFGRWAEEVTADLRTGSGSELFHFMGRRSVLIEMIHEFDTVQLGFLERVLASRRALAEEMKQVEKLAAQKNPQDEED